MRKSSFRSVKELVKFCIKKDNKKNKKNQHCNSYRHRSMKQRGKVVSLCVDLPDVDGLYSRLDKDRGTKLFDILSLILWFKGNVIGKIRCSQGYISKKVDCNYTYCNELIGLLADRGWIIKRSHGRYKTCEYDLHPFWLLPQYQEILYMFFSGIRLLSVALLMSGKPTPLKIPTFDKPRVGLGVGDPNLVNRLYIYNKNNCNCNRDFSTSSSTPRIKISPAILPEHQKHTTSVRNSNYYVRKEVEMNEIGGHYKELEELHKLNMTSFGKFKLTVLPRDIVVKLYRSFLGKPNFPSYERFFNLVRIESERQSINIEKRLQEFEALCKDMQLDPDSPVVPEKKQSEEYFAFEAYLASPEGQQAQAALGPLKNPFENKDES